MNIWEFTKRQIGEYGTKTALVCGERSLSYREFTRAVERAPARPERFVVCAETDPIEQTVAIFRAFRNGVAAIPLCAQYGVDRYLAELESVREVDADVALVLFTSGSSGRPKGVMLTQDNVTYDVAAIRRYFAVGESDKILIARPLMHAAVLVGELLLSLLAGLTVHFYGEAFNPARVVSYIETAGITVFCGTPTVLNLMLRAAGSGRLASLKHVAVSGERLSENCALLLADKLPQASLYSVYGLTEASPRVSYLPPPLFRERLCSIGRPLEGAEMKLVSGGGEVLSPRETGRLFVRSPGVMRGYLAQPALTAEKLRGGWLDTGDLAWRDEAGYYYIAGRGDSMLIRCGMNVYPEEIEAYAKRCPKVEEALCYARADALLGTTLGVRIVRAPGHTLSVEEVRAYLRAGLPAYMIPSSIEFVDSLEKTPSGKLRRI